MERRKSLVEQGMDICMKAQAERRDLDGTEAIVVSSGLKEIETLNSDIEAAQDHIKKAGPTDEMFRKLNDAGPVEGTKSPWETPDTKAFAETKGGRVSFAGQKAAAAITSKAAPRGGGVKALLDSGSTSTVPLDQGNAVIATGRPAASIFDVIDAVKVDTPSVSYLVQSARNLAAAPVAAGGTKPKSTMSVKRVTEELTVVAHIVEGLSKYDLSDNQALGTFVQDEMAYGLSEAVAGQIISGDGVGPNFTGITETSGVRTQAATASPVITVRTALSQLEASGYEPAAILLNPSDWLSIETTQTTDGGFLLGSGATGAPLDAVERRLWGVRVALSSRVTAGTAIVLGKGSVTLFHDGQLFMEWDASSGFDTNELRARFEGRFQIGVQRPDAVVIATLA